MSTDNFCTLCKSILIDRGYWILKYPPSLSVKSYTIFQCTNEKCGKLFSKSIDRIKSERT